MNAVLDRDVEGNVIRKAGVMGIVIAGGDVKPGDSILVELPEGTSSPLKPV
jgi:MOSC domain-containing protein YiiM